MATTKKNNSSKKKAASRTASKAVKKQQCELAGLADALPFKELSIPEFTDPHYQPESIRQKRIYVKPESNMQAVGRFLMERGTVEILSQENILELFKEIHWCAEQIRSLSRTKFRSEDRVHSALMDARRFISRIEAAEEELFIANRRLVVSCVRPFFWIGQVWLADFLQEGSKALSNAVRKYDFTRGTTFYVYAQKAIQNRLRNYFRDHVRSGSIGIRPSREMTAIKNLLDQWAEEQGGTPPDEVIAKLTGVAEQRVKKLKPFIEQWQKMPAPPLSLDAEIGENTTTLYQFIEDPDAKEASDSAQKSEIWAAVNRLPPRARYIMRLRFLEGRTLEETGQELNLTRARIKQIQDDALRKLRQMLRRGIETPNM